MPQILYKIAQRWKGVNFFSTHFPKWIRGSVSALGHRSPSSLNTEGLKIPSWTQPLLTKFISLGAAPNSSSSELQTQNMKHLKYASSSSWHLTPQWSSPPVWLEACPNFKRVRDDFPQVMLAALKAVFIVSIYRFPRDVFLFLFPTWSLIVFSGPVWNCFGYKTSKFKNILMHIKEECKDINIIP